MVILKWGPENGRTMRRGQRVMRGVVLQLGRNCLIAFQWFFKSVSNGEGARGGRGEIC